MYKAKLTGVPDALIFFWFFSFIKARRLRPPAKFARYITENLTYLDSFPGLGRGLDLLLVLFFYQEKAAAAAGEVFQVHNGESHVPGQLPRPRQRP